MRQLILLLLLSGRVSADASALMQHAFDGDVSRLRSELEAGVSPDALVEAKSPTALMLAATASSSVSVKSDSEATNILWPIRCLLKIGLARNCMSTALALLNTSIPDALRCRAAKSSGVNGPLLHLSKAIVTMILASDPPLSAGCLLDLTETPNEHDSSARYWQSLDHDTRIAFSTIAVGSHHPLLRETEVRSWALDRITGYFESSLMQREDLAHSETMTQKDTHSLPSEWMVEVCWAILSNAGYRVEAVTAEFTDTNTDAKIEESYSLRKRWFN